MDGRTDGQTPHDGIVHASIASRGKNEKVIQNPHADPYRRKKLISFRGSPRAHAYHVYRRSLPRS